jgi:hypothetical protein
MKRTLVALLTFAVAAPAFAGAQPIFQSVPTLDEAGLVALTLVVAIAGGIAARRRKK